MRAVVFWHIARRSHPGRIFAGRVGVIHKGRFAESQFFISKYLVSYNGILLRFFRYAALHATPRAARRGGFDLSLCGACRAARLARMTP
jgi:hypothetical protein